MKKWIVAVCLVLFVSGAVPLYAHCQIPCGIYDDALRTVMILEDLDTVDKSIAAIQKLSAEKPLNYNQLVRWIENKDTHAQKIQTVVTDYFMMQRIAPVKEGTQGYATYLMQITLLHQMLVDAMKVKQNPDPAITARMRETWKAFQKVYPPAALPQHQH